MSFVAVNCSSAIGLKLIATIPLATSNDGQLSTLWKAL